MIIMVLIVMLFMPVAAFAQSQQAQLTPMPMFGPPPQVNFGHAYEDCPSGSSCGQAAWIAGQLIYAGGFISGMAVIRPPVTKFTNSATGVGIGLGGQGGNATATATGGSVNPPPGGGGPVNPNP